MREHGERRRATQHNQCNGQKTIRVSAHSSHWTQCILTHQDEHADGKSFFLFFSFCFRFFLRVNQEVLTAADRR